MYNFKETEEKVLKFWEYNQVYEKSKKKNQNGRKFYFMDGPPYATGHIHMGTALNKILKDIAMRSRRLQGFDVFDRPGYDTHGIPIEFQVEKEIGSKNKQDIERFGVDKFIARCKEFATQYIGIMNSEFMNLGVWMDWKNPYLTLTDDYIEAIWHAFKEAEKKGLLYLGKYSVHVCPRCETAVAYNEIVYEKRKETSIYVKFPLKDRKNTYLIIWTTTPWTLPGNTGVMAHPDVVYQEIEISKGENWIIAKDLVQKVMALTEIDYKVKSEFPGKDMLGWQYISPLAKNLKLEIKNGYKVVLSSRYVTTEDGTGLVHTAPGHGKEDYEVGMEYGLDIISPININGQLTDEAGKYSGKRAKIVDEEIIDDLKKDGFLVYELLYEHDYPLCWRDREPLLMMSQPQWFLKISEIHKKLLQSNEEVDWLPQYSKLRMQAWLEGIGDWPVSRQRYWGTPLPIWHDAESGEKIVVGSIKELQDLSGNNNIEIHKPAIDSITIKSKSGKILKRVPEVLDVWFDSGVSSWAALGYPQNKQLFEKYWPADLNIEGRDQFRGWWNSQLILSTISFDKKPFDSILVHGMVLDLGKRKMSKSLGNIVSPQDVINKHGRDFIRYYFAKFSRGEDFSYDEKEFENIRKVITTLLNITSFISQLSPGEQKIEIEDKWILSKFQKLLKGCIEEYNSYRFFNVIQKIEEFLIFDLSRKYIQIIRERADESHDVLNEIRLGILGILAPICPFITETSWQELRETGAVNEESIHLSLLPEAKIKLIDENLEKEFDTAFNIIEKALAERDKAQAGLKWPLAKAMVKLPKEAKVSGETIEILKRQLNIKNIEIKEGEELIVEIDTKPTPELESEGFAREISRKVQAERKNASLVKSDRIKLCISGSESLTKKITSQSEFIKNRTNSDEIIITLKNDTAYNNSAEFEVKNEKISIFFSKI